jgi:hypothetical protein
VRTARGPRRTAVGVQRRVGLRDDEVVLLVGGEVDDLVGDLALDDLAVRRLDEAEPVDAPVGDSEPMRPMFGPSGVSIGHMRP